MGTHRNCEGVTRRDCLRLGLGALGVAGFTDLLRLSAQAAEGGASPRRPTSCILVWLDGGPSHIETFDPKPEAPSEIRGEFLPIRTKTPGIIFSQHMKRLAAISDKLAIVRSVHHDQGNHGAGNHYMMTGRPPRIPVGCGAFVSFHPSLGSATAYERGAPGALPAYFSIPSMTRSGGPSFLGAKYAPFVLADNPNSANFHVRDLALPGGLTDRRFESRRDLRALVDRLERIDAKAAGDPVPALDDYYEQGYNLVTSPEAQRAFAIDQESEKTREAYGRNAFGQRVLLARRLVEAGVPFITLNNGGWDHHVDIFGGMANRLPPLDQALAALVEDLDQRGLLDTTLLVVLGEFGRTPKLSVLSGQTKVGRNHWSNAMSILFAGCGTPGGQVVGATDRKGHAPIDRPLSPEKFVSTIYRKLGIDPGKIYYAPNGRPITLVTDPEPIQELMG